MFYCWYDLTIQGGLSLFCFRNDRVTIQEREKIAQESEVSEEKAKKVAEERKKVAAKVSPVSVEFRK